MNKIECYDAIIGLEFLGDCSDSKIARIARGVRYVANKKLIYKLLEKFGFNTVGYFTIAQLKNSYIPYSYYIDEKYIVVVNFEIDYIFKIKR